MIALLLCAMAASPSTPCVECHTAEHDAWKGSRHAQSFLNAGFRASYDRAPHPWCLTCHAPDAAAPTDGVTCAACHVRDGVVLAARPPSSNALAAHRVVEDPALAGSRMCARCHEFNLPQRILFERERKVVPSDFPAQETFTEWQSTSSTRQCQACHNHAARGGHDAAWVRGALQLVVERKGDTVHATLSAPRVGHRFPTGDPFHRIRIALCDDEECTRPRGSATWGRTVEPTPTGWSVVEDTRVPPGGAVTRVIPLLPSTPEQLHYRLTYHFNDPLLNRALPEREKSYVLTRGMVTPGGH